MQMHQRARSITSKVLRRIGVLLLAAPLFAVKKLSGDRRMRVLARSRLRASDSQGVMSMQGESPECE